MIRDGVDREIFDPGLRKFGWRPINTAPIAALDVDIGLRTTAFSTLPNRIEGLTTHYRVVRCRYRANGHYDDRWTDEAGSVEYRLIAWRPL